jgi:hypothetical protein
VKPQNGLASNPLQALENFRHTVGSILSFAVENCVKAAAASSGQARILRMMQKRKTAFEGRRKKL